MFDRQLIFLVNLYELSYLPHRMFQKPIEMLLLIKFA